jgi:protein-S-isoprenylcysteine O-methyltransferase Ste14
VKRIAIVLGAATGLLFFAWVERGGTLPALARELGWPWVEGAHWPLAARLAWNAGLFLAFGALHTAFAQPGRRLPRPLYVAQSGAALFGVMSLWQSTGVVAWAAPLGWHALNLVSILLFWAFLALAGFSLLRFGLGSFLGLTDSPADTGGSLVTTGIYGYVRHPVYLFTLLAFWATPWMTLDRLWVAALTALYLAFAIPVEERKLAAIYGDTYDAYRARVPAVIPRFWPRHWPRLWS